MNLLVLTYYNFNQALTGSSNRVLNLLRNLPQDTNITIIHKGENFKVQNLSFIGYEGLSGFGPYVEFLCSNIFEVLRGLSQSYNIVQVESPYQIIPAFLFKIWRNIPNLILSEHNVEVLTSTTFLRNIIMVPRVMLLIPIQFLYELIASHIANHVITVSYDDKNRIQRLFRVFSEKISVIPNGVPQISQDSERKINHDKTVFFHGTLNWYPNHEAVKKILEKIAPNLPNIKFKIAGKNIEKKLLKGITSTDNVSYLGYVSSLMEEILSSDICIAPISSGGGTKLKVLEYAVAGKPIVATKKAVEGLGFTHGYDCLLSKNVGDDFIINIQKVLSDPVLSITLGKNAKVLAQRYSWISVAHKLSNLYSQVLSSK